MALNPACGGIAIAHCVANIPRSAAVTNHMDTGAKHPIASYILLPWRHTAGQHNAAAGELLLFSF